MPFLEHDDANRALMGANMQRQAVPLIRSHAPLVGTGMEGKLARDSGVCTLARRDGIVESVDATRIVVRPDSDKPEIPDIYPLMKFQRSNQSTCYNQKPIVRAGERVKAGDVLADGPSCDMGELALGQNVLVAFMPWQGYNFEDSILVSERIAKDDVFTSIHIEEFECVARDTKLGKEEVTRDIPNVGEEALKDLDESGIVRIGAEVKPGDILVGKITPKGETQLSPEEKLLRAIFGEKAGDVRDSSLRVPPGVGGIVINARVFSRKGTEKDERVEGHRGPRARAPREDARRGDQDPPRLVLPPDQEAARRHDDDGQARRRQGQGPPPEGRAARRGDRSTTIPRKYWAELPVEGAEEIAQKVRELEEIVALREEHFRDKIDRLSKGDELPPGVIKMVKVYIAIKRKLQVGDKMAGRHGNKGVISRILPEEDMPYLQDGTPVDIVLNPLGVPSRMNVGQILETHLGWGARVLGAQLQYMLEEKFGVARDARPHQARSSTATRTSPSWLDEADRRRRASSWPTSCKRGVHYASPVFDGAQEQPDQEHARARGSPRRAARRCSSTGAPARRSTRR